MFVTDVWDDIRELTSGYFAGDEALRDTEGKTLAQATGTDSTSPSDNPLFDESGRCRVGSICGIGDNIDCGGAAGNGKSIGIELDKVNVEIIRERLGKKREADDISGPIQRL